MPTWALGITLGLAVLNALQPEILAAIAAAEAAGQDTTSHTNGLSAVNNAIASLNGALLGAPAKQ